MITVSLKEGQQLHGFVVSGIIPLPEINITMVRLRHERTGARMVHLAADDDNNMFGVGFRTTPDDSTGVAHILEHTVLCGSRRYPVRDPFFSMIKRSLNTFMNALTSSDWTFYPFSSQNRKDFYNLMGIYLDAVFFPLLRERDFRQEGHRVEFAEQDNPDSPLVFKGVVYNEMKGAMADPSSLIGRRLGKALYPTTTYGNNSGGEPADIPNLTWEELREFHASYYHPANAYFFSYGDFPLENHLEYIEKEALAGFGPLEVNTAVADEVRFTAPRRVTETFPVDPGETLENRSMVQVGWLTNPVADSFHRLSIMLLETLLLGDQAAPLYKALIDSHLGQSLAPGSGYHDDHRETCFAAGLQGTNPEAVEQIEQLVLSVLEEVATNGFPPERIESAIHQLEFSTREVSGDQYPYPLLLLMRLLGPWLHDDDPVTPLLLDRDLTRLREELASGPFFQELVRRYFLDNPHRVTVLLQPDPAQREREELETMTRLEKLRQSLSDKERAAIVSQARELQEAQESREDISCLPTLELADIPATERPVPFSREEVAGIPVYWFDQPTNGICYFTATIAADRVPAELSSYLPLFCSLLTQIGAAGFSYLEMAERIAAATGGIQARTSILDDPRDLGRFQASIEFKGKALLRNQEQMFGILSDIIKAPDFTDLARLHTVISQVKISWENSIPSAGHSYAARIAAARLSPASALREGWKGIEQVRFVKSIAALPVDGLGDVAEKFRTLAGILLTAEGLNCSITAEAGSFAPIAGSLRSFLGNIPAGGEGGETAGGLSAPDIDRASGWAATMPVAHVAQTFLGVPFVHEDAAGLVVLSRLLKACYLHREIREKGGAYGGLAGFDPESGVFSLMSYRDPNLTRTLRVYRDAVEWVCTGDFSDEEVKEAILAVFTSLDKPLSPGGKGAREFANQLQGLTTEMRQELRQRVLAVDRKTLATLADRYLRAGWGESSTAVIAGEEMLLKANEELGVNGLKIERI